MKSKRATDGSLIPVPALAHTNQSLLVFLTHSTEFVALAGESVDSPCREPRKACHYERERPDFLTQMVFPVNYLDS